MQPIRFFVPILVAATLAVPNAAVAEQGGFETVSQAVPYGDLNLATPAGVAAFDRRISSAISLLCGRPDPYSANGHREMRRCRTEAQASAQSQRNTTIAAAQRRSVDLASR